MQNIFNTTAEILPETKQILLIKYPIVLFHFDNVKVYA